MTHGFDFTDIPDAVAFLEILSSLPPIDKRIAMLMLKGYTRQEIGVYVDRSRSTIYRHVKKMRKIFGENGKNTES